MKEITCKIMDGELQVNNELRKTFFEHNEGKWVTITQHEQNRTSSQNAALHTWYSKVAEALNDGGYNIQLVLKEKVDLDWTMESVKELLWRPAQKAILGKVSTTKLKKQQDIDTVFEHLNRHLAEKFGVHIPFPSYGPGYKDSAPLRDK